MTQNKGPASEGKLGELHEKVATVMTAALDKIIDQQNAPVDPDMPAQELNPALLSVMVRFLDANKITCAPAEGNAMGELATKLEAKRKKRRVGNVTQLFDDE